VPHGVRAGTDAGRTRAAEGDDRRLILCTRNRTDPISGFANNGDAPAGWNVKPFHAWHQRDGGKHSYTWVKNRLQEAGVVQKAPGRGKHRKRCTRAAWPGMMLHQDGSTHDWVPGVKWNWVVTMDDATNEHYSMRRSPR